MSLTLIIALISSLGGMVSNFLSADGIIPGNLSSLISASISAIGQLVTAFQSGGTPTSELQASLAALQAELTAVQQDTSTDPSILGDIAEISGLVQDAVTGFEAAQGGADPSTIPVPPAVI